MEDEPGYSGYACCLCIPTDFWGFNKGVGTLSFFGISYAIANVALHSNAIVTSNDTRSDSDCERFRCIGYGSAVGRKKTICWIILVLVSDHRHRVSAHIVDCASGQGSLVSVAISLGVLAYSRSREGKE